MSTDKKEAEEVDVFKTLKTLSIDCLDEGFVKLVEVTPRICPSDRTPEFAIVRSARVSYGNGLKTQAEDDKLLKYLITNKHTSPLESVQFTFHIKCPKFVAIHFIRHRTAKINEFSQRYAEIKDNSWYHPTKFKEGVRKQDVKNKQSSTTDNVTEDAVKCMQEAEALVDKVFEMYHRLLKAGVAKEVARAILPMSTYTEMYFTLDLNNFVKFAHLRADKHSQLETQVYAKAMIELVRPLVPTVLSIENL